MFTTTKYKLIAVVALTCVSVSAERVFSAVHLWDVLTTNQLNILSDDSAEKLIDYTGGGDTFLDVGDQLVSIFQINSLTAPSPIKNFGIDWTNEFTGVSQIEVVSKVATGALGVFAFTFGPTGVLNAANPLGIAGWTPSTTIATWSDAANDFSTTTGSIAGDVLTASGGTRAWDFGITGVGAETWIATGVDDFSLFPGLAPGFPGGTFFLAQNAITNGAAPPLLPFAPLGTDITGQGSVFNSPGVGAYWDAGDNVDVFLFPIPEPASILAWGGIVFLSTTVARRRKFRKSA